MTSTATNPTNDQSAERRVRQMRERSDRHREDPEAEAFYKKLDLEELAGRGRMRADALRYAQALRAAIGTMRSEVMRSTERSLAQLDELELWAHTGKPPETQRVIGERFDAHSGSCQMRVGDSSDVPAIEVCSCEVGKQYRLEMADMTLAEAPIMPLLEKAWFVEDGEMPIDLYGEGCERVRNWLQSIESMFPKDSPAAARIQDAALKVLAAHGSAAPTAAATAPKTSTVVRIDSKRTKRVGGAR